MTMCRPPLKFLILSLSVAAVILLASCTPDHPQSTFGTAGPVAEKQLILFKIIFWMAVPVFVAVEGALVYVVFRYARRRGRVEMPPQTHGHTKLEVAWTVAPALVVIAIAAPTVFYIFDIADTPDAGTFEVTVTGHQWWWEFEYPQQDLVSAQVITANEMHFPVNRQIKVNLRSDDVIHSFWIPKIAGKVDVVPRGGNEMQFTAEETGVFYGQCTELCGVAHAHMRFRVIVQTEEEFVAWVDNYHSIAGRTAPLGPGGAPPSPEVSQGFAAFAALGCLLCHDVNGPGFEVVRQSRMVSFDAGAQVFPAPNLTNFATRTTMAAGIMDLNRENLVRWLLDPDDVKPGNRMGELAPLYSQPDQVAFLRQNVDDLATYLLSLK